VTKSPCKNICRIDKKSGFCIGCNRSLIEISNWSNLSEDKKKQIIFELNSRNHNNIAKKALTNQ
tara:strand:- start:215 stop:406 length:192 start_codon:yes stop_codon:yes gene_type:complete